jgi:hypothetical protein
VGAAVVVSVAVGARVAVAVGARVTVAVGARVTVAAQTPVVDRAVRVGATACLPCRLTVPAA